MARRLRAAFRISCFAGLLASLASVQLHAQEETMSNDSIVELPPLVVAESAKAPFWRYVRLPEAEILSGCSVRVTEEFAESYRRLDRMLDLILPDHLRLQTATPRIHVLVSEEQVTQVSDEVVSEMLRAEKGRDLTEALRNEVSRSLSTRGSSIGISSNDPFARRTYAVTATPAPGAVRFLPNLRLWDGDAGAVFAVIRESTFHGDNLALAPDWFRFVLAGRTPPLPSWFVDGMVALHKTMQVRRTEIVLPAMEWLSSQDMQLIRQNPRARHGLLPMADLFVLRAPANPQDRERHLQLREAQLVLFLRWVFDERTSERRQALWKFVVSTSSQRPTEALFRECFGVDYTNIENQLNTYLPRAIRGTVRVRAETGEKPPPLKARPATAAEIGRIKGEWERLQANYVKARHPAFVSHYLSQAHETLYHALGRGEQDPALFAAVGLFECDAGNDEAALGFLEKAAAAHVPRPRVYQELARIKLTEARAQNPDGKLTSEQTNRLIRLLVTATAFAPPLPEVYELIATVWSHSPGPLPAEALAMLDEGVRFFPRHARLVYLAAKLNAREGFAAKATMLADLGLTVAPNEEAKAHFTALKTSLPHP